jgi:hypothetical protein
MEAKEGSQEGQLRYIAGQKNVEEDRSGISSGPGLSTVATDCTMCC